MLVIHPLIVHWPLTLWPLLLLAVSINREWLTPKTVVFCWISTIATLAAGLWDEASARDHLARAWMLDDHRALGILTTMVSSVVTARLLQLRDTSLVQSKLLLLLVTVMVWITGFLGHRAVYLAPWNSY